MHMPRKLAFSFGGAQLKVKFGEFSEAVHVFVVSTLHQFSTFGGAQLTAKFGEFSEAVQVSVVSTYQFSTFG